MVVKSTNRSRNDSDFPLRQPTDQKAGGSNLSRRATPKPLHRNGFGVFLYLLGWGKNADVFQMSFRQLASLSAIPCLLDAKPNFCLSSAAVTQALSSSVRSAASAPMRCCRQVPVAAGTLIGFKRAHFAPVYFLRSYLKRNTNLAIIEKRREVRACISESWKRARPWCRFCRASASGRVCSIRMRTKYP